MGPDINFLKCFGKAQASDTGKETLCLPSDFLVSSSAFFMFSHLGKCGWRDSMANSVAGWEIAWLQRRRARSVILAYDKEQEDLG